MDTKNCSTGQTLYNIGIDQHKHYSMVGVMDQAGNKLMVQKLYHNDKEAIKEFFRQFPSTSARIALEATGFWYWLYDLLESLGLEVKLVHPLKVRLIAENRIKTDKVDAFALAELLRLDALPVSYIPSHEIRDCRELLRHRIVLVHQRTSLKNRIESVLSKLGIEKEVVNLYSLEGKSWLKGLNLSEPYQLELNNYLELIEKLTEMVVGLDKHINKYLTKDERAKYLESIPGVGRYTAYLILAEIGDINRFGSAKKLASYAGLVPSVHQSGQVKYFGRITKEGDIYLRCGMVEAAHVAVRFDEGLKARYQKLRRYKGSAKAITAMARELIEIVYCVLKEKRNYYRKYQKTKGLELITTTE